MKIPTPYEIRVMAKTAHWKASADDLSNELSAKMRANPAANSWSAITQDMKTAQEVRDRFQKEEWNAWVTEYKGRVLIWVFA